MSANIYWHPVERKEKEIPAHAPQAFLSTLEKVFDHREGRFGKSCLPQLRAMAAVTPDAQMQKCYIIMADAIERYGEIEIWVEY